MIQELFDTSPEKILIQWSNDEKACLDLETESAAHALLLKLKELCLQRYGKDIEVNSRRE